MSGTLIHAACGPIAVEALQAGDQVEVLRDGQKVLETVKWVGHSWIDLARYVHVEDAAPIRFRHDAIADRQPARDLFLSPEHCLILDGLCVPAKLLVNGGSIVSKRSHPPFTYYHVELDRHGILFAENTPAESYLDTGNRSVFDNSGQPRQLHPAFSLNSDAARWKTDACAPLANVPNEVGPIWRRLAARSAELGYAISAVQTTERAGLHVVADGHAIQPIFSSNSHHVFLVPAGTNAVSLVSRFCIPADRMICSLRDTRRLGLRVNWMSICCGTNEAILPADHPTLETGWNTVEQDPTGMWRWTDGNASIPWENVSGSAVLTVRGTALTAYPIYEERSRLVA